MDIKIDQDTIAQAVASVVEKGIADGIGSWEVRQGLEAAINAAVTEADMPARLKEQLEGILAERAEDVMAEVMEAALPGLKEGMRFVILTGLQSMMYGMLSGKPNSYQTDEMKLWNDAGRMLDPAALAHLEEPVAAD